ncbi:adenylyl-sulfate kinase [Hippea jasoniae]|uniref:adenylyl-sulfate kinase n=1 Tax=Hippea jasoniae TaxID=944479 RepID=UPI0018DD90DA|nr:adenylyl-sulfate kinase [Hippea jasoniae]
MGKIFENRVISNNVFWYKTRITKHHRMQLTNQKPCVLWFTGLSGSGKTTIANKVESLLFNNKNLTYLLDGDNIRHGLNRDLGFDEHSRKENIRRVTEVAKLFVDSGLIVLVALISPYRKDREFAKSILEAGEFVEIYIDTPIEVCEQRDVKGLYKKARSGIIKNFTGIDAPYEPPLHPDIHIKTIKMSADDASKSIFSFLVNKGYINVR